MPTSRCLKSGDFFFCTSPPSPTPPKKSPPTHPPPPLVAKWTQASQVSVSIHDSWVKDGWKLSQETKHVFENPHFFWIQGKFVVKIANCREKIRSRFYPGDVVTHTADREIRSISRRLPDNPGGLTYMQSDLTSTNRRHIWLMVWVLPTHEISVWFEWLEMSDHTPGTTPLLFSNSGVGSLINVPS